MIPTLVLILALLLMYEALEIYVHSRIRRSIPIRIHVNGTRGKSSVTRLIAAGLRAGGLRVFAKTTGSAPRIILPDGSEEPVVRYGKPNIIEQIKVFRYAKKHKANAVVIECMAVRPDFQKISEDIMIRSTTGVITNVREDHLDLMGPGIEDVAHALSSTLPREGKKCYTAESRAPLLDILRSRAKKRGIEMVQTEHSWVTDEMMRGFSYLEHRENVALALTLCESFGVPREKALVEMHRAQPDPGALRGYRFEFEGKKIEFLDAFAANDPESTYLIWVRLCRGFKEGQTKVVILNTRRERLQRSLQLSQMIAEKGMGDYIFLTGDNQYLVKNVLKRKGIKSSAIIPCGHNAPAHTFRKILALSSARLSIFAIGNIGGDGYRHVEFFRRVFHQSVLGKN